ELGVLDPCRLLQGDHVGVTKRLEVGLQRRVNRWVWLERRDPRSGIERLPVQTRDADVRSTIDNRGRSGRTTKLALLLAKQRIVLAREAGPIYQFECWSEQLGRSWYVTRQRTQPPKL